MYIPTFLNVELNHAWNQLENQYRVEETQAVDHLLKYYETISTIHESASGKAYDIIQHLRQNKLNPLRIESLLQTYRLSTQEGLALMCMAEAFLRIPDNSTKGKLIRDKLSLGSWENTDESTWVERLANFSLNQASKFLSLGSSGSAFSHIPALIRRFGEPFIRQIMVKIIHTMGQQFVVGETIEKAISKKGNALYSFDMLGEAAKTQEDAKRYFDAYLNAIETLKNQPGDILEKSSISIKLSALHPRYEVLKRDTVKAELGKTLLQLCQAAKNAGIMLTVDAEEAERLELSLEIIHDVYVDESLKGWGGFGLAVQAYQKRAHVVVDWLILMAKSAGEPMHIRLVKGAYWDSEIKWCQERGLSDYPVFTQKAHTDLSYLVCAEKILSASSLIYGQFATHNAYTAAFVLEMAAQKSVTKFELQRLYGMGESLYEHVQARQRVYGPVGVYKDLLAYLVRRLLENGANSSFVHQIYDMHLSTESLVKSVNVQCLETERKPHSKIKLPIEMYGTYRRNSKGDDLSSYNFLKHIQPLIRSYSLKEAPEVFGADQLTKLLNHADQAQAGWERVGVESRAHIIEKLGDLLDEHRDELMQILCAEARKTIGDCIAEIREAIDFCYYYANQARQLLGSPVQLPGPTGELNNLSYHARGVFVCIAPWNFPLAIFIGQAVAALVTGNTVLVKPSHQTPRVGLFAVELAHKAGVPKDVFQFIHCKGIDVSEYLLTDARVKGVVFTGSTDTAIRINQTLASRAGQIIPLIAETGGMNAMIVDSSALHEQVVTDVISSAFQSAGQRCSALRVLFVQEDVADNLLHMLSNAMSELEVNDPRNLNTDVGPLIDSTAKESLRKHIEYLSGLEKIGHAKNIYTCSAPEEGDFFSPELWEIEGINFLKEEVFGPIVHVVRFKANDLEKIFLTINETGYGLTMGIHSRLESTIAMAERFAKVGNLYINRNMIGAVVGVQPFGGEGLSGTGPKAGGPNYLLRFVHERTFTQNITACGGNTTLLGSI
jgi:RHH-type proline utilization regulon transcriptional repressor/proline dehydrogenase/delta 1-pyrroline-5-carboxylate dehydrogenase